jgi:hypothetical protein
VSAPEALANGLQMSSKNKVLTSSRQGVESEVTQAQIVVPVE